MSFYKMLVNDYDLIFPYRKTTYSFLKNTLKGNKKILDLAAGIGTYTAAFSKDGFDVLGIELSGDMVEKGLSLHEGIHLIEGDMRQFKNENFGPYDLVYCIGNSIVHLDSKEEIKGFLCDIFDSLSDGGRMVIQIVNYDRIMQKQLDRLPTIEYGKGKSFERLYNFKGQKIEFKGRLVNGKDVLEDSVMLLPVLRGELSAMLNSIGFSNIKFYSGFDKSPYTTEKMPLVIEAFK